MWQQSYREMSESLSFKAKMSIWKPTKKPTTTTTKKAFKRCWFRVKVKTVFSSHYKPCWTCWRSKQLLPICSQEFKWEWVGCYISASPKLCDNICIWIMKLTSATCFLCSLVFWGWIKYISWSFQMEWRQKNNLICTSLQQNNQMKHASDRYLVGKGESHNIHLI